MKLPKTLSSEAEMEAYIFFDAYIRPLPKKPDGRIDTMKRGVFQHNDVDAFRHAYVSGVFTLEYGDTGARFFGWLNELHSSSAPGDENMDYWNNAVGRELALKHKTRADLARAVKKALENGELITSLNDKRKYEGASIMGVRDSSVVVSRESDSGANELFFDTKLMKEMTREKFVEEIEAGFYPDHMVRTVNGVRYPASKKDKREDNNLG